MVARSTAPKLSVIIPVYNEAQTIVEAIARVRRARLDLAKEIVVVDDASNDDTRSLLERLITTEGDPMRIVVHSVNRGKGAAVRTGLAEARGEIILIQDADLEYDPRDYRQLLEPILEGVADVVYGNRFHSGPHRVLYFWHHVGNRVLTLVANVLTGLNLSDMEVGYKAFRREVLKSVTLKSDRFGFEPEITIKVAKLGSRIFEVPIRYYGRTYEEGKKITWRDGIAALFHLFRYRFFD